MSNEECAHTYFQQMGFWEYTSYFIIVFDFTDIYLIDIYIELTKLGYIYSKVLINLTEYFLYNVLTQADPKVEHVYL